MILASGRQITIVLHVPGSVACMRLAPIFSQWLKFNVFYKEMVSDSVLTACGEVFYW